METSPERQGRDGEGAVISAGLFLEGPLSLVFLPKRISAREPGEKEDTLTDTLGTLQREWREGKHQRERYI